MQNKGLIRFLTWAFVLVCLYQLSFTFVTSRIEKNAAKAADAYVQSTTAQNLINTKSHGDALYAQTLKDSLSIAREAAYLDSMASEKVYLGYTYRQCQSREINLGLDLKGGMNVMLEVSTVDVVRALAGHTEDSVFNKAIDIALATQKKTTNRDFVSLFYDAIRQVNPDVQLASYFNTQLRDRIKLNDDNDAVIKVVKEEAASAYDRTYEILRQRIDKFGVAQPTIQQLRASERILVELPGVKDPQRVRKLLQGTAQLEFWLTYDNAEAYRMLDKVDSYISSIGGTEANTEETAQVVDTTAEPVAESDSLLSALGADNNTESASTDELSKDHPLFNENMLMPNINPQGGLLEGPVVGYAHAKSRDAISRMIATAFEKRVIDK